MITRMVVWSWDWGEYGKEGKGNEIRGGLVESILKQMNLSKHGGKSL